ncbi:uncharacterized protein LOC114465680 [Gouania willdenowi]|uniref:Uncharacterized LOC114465680 n=1 Tax=Gouania willdenowi TaxID=441366 RepID=A0A8C5HN25_GOUWI|nr:uncharacterized protein LOC114465680 [Gouania willdenowi]
MEIKRGTEGGSSRGSDPPLRYLRLLAPPLQLLSAAVWQVVQRGLVDQYGMLEEFVTMVTELVPELMSYSQRAQLILGLRARLVLEMCRGEHPVDMQTIQPHLDRIKAPVSSAKDHDMTINQVEESEVNFVELVHSLLEDPLERKYFFQEIFPVYFGSKYDAALEMLVWEFISRLEDLMPVPDFTQLAMLLGDAPSFLQECLQSLFPPENMKSALEYHRNLGHFQEKDPGLLPMEDCILSSLSLPLGVKAVMGSASCSPPHKDSASSERQRPLSAPIRTSSLDRSSRRSSEAIRLNLKDTKEPGNTAQEGNRVHKPINDTIDLTTSNENADTDSCESSRSLRAEWAVRKRKLSGGVDFPSKKTQEASAFVDSSLDDENSNESPLISIWGEYTDSQELPLPAASDTKVPWTDDETLDLLNIWGKDSMQRALKGCLKNRHIFTQIAQKMSERGHMRTVEQCQTRIKRLKTGLRHNKGNSRIERKIYTQLQQILDSSASSSTPDVAYNVEEEESQDDDDDLQIIGHTEQPETGTRSVPWTDLETLALIKIWAEDKMQQELRGAHRTGHSYSLISGKMAVQGFTRTAEQCQTRLKRLKTNFRQCYQNNLRGEERVECKFYNQLGRILVKDFPSVPEVNEVNQEPEDVYSHQDLDSAAAAHEDRRKFPWSDKETIILLELWGDPQVQQCLRLYPHNGHIFTEISEKLEANGYFRSSEQCHTRIKRLKSSYRQCQENMSSSGTDRVDFKFYDLLEQILEKQPSSSSTVITESIEVSEDSNGEAESGPDKDEEVSLPVGRTTSSLWSDEETVALIGIWGEEDVQKALRGFVHNGHIYAEISDRMHSLGFSKTSEQCRWKVKSLRVNFRQCYDRKQCGRKVDYKFYYQLERILGPETVFVDEEEDREEQLDQGSVNGFNTAWTDPETATLIELWAADDVQLNLKTSVHNGHIFAEISEKMATLGFMRTAEQCQCRVKRLKKGYRRFCNNRKTGGRPATYRYFTLLAPVLGDESSVVEAENTLTNASIEPILDEEPVMYEQPSTSHLLMDTSRKTPWSVQETRTLLDIWGEDNVQLTLKGCLKNRHVFFYISEKMNEHGFIRTSEQCYTRIKRLKHGFLHEKEDFKFFNDMEKIFSKKLSVNETVADTSQTEEMDDCEPEHSQRTAADTSWTKINTQTNTAPANSWVMSDNPKMPWSDGETEALLSIWGSKEIQEDLKGCTKNKHIFLQISQAMTSQGYMRSPEQCQSRIKRLRANFKNFLEGRRGEKQECKFFEQMVQIFGNKYVLNSDALADDTAKVIES